MPDFPIPSSANYQKFIANGTWTKPPGATVILIECIGAGTNGQPGGTYVNNPGGGNGGNGGAYSWRLLPASIVGAAETITVGASGGLSSFGSWLAAGATLSEYAGASGGYCHINSQGYFDLAQGGKQAYLGGGGGGSGAPASGYTASYNGGDGGSTGTLAGGTGGGGAGGIGVGSFGSTGADGVNNLCGAGGGGGGSGYPFLSGNGGNGGNGGAPGGGGGGGGACAAGYGYSPGWGGQGGRGEVRVYAW